MTNFLEYVPGTMQGTDLVYYEARNNVSFPEPSGPAKLFFISQCCGSQQADACRVCGGNGLNCEQSCDKQGGVRDQCGVCNGDGNSCKGCDNRPFSPNRFDSCGVCGGDGTSCFSPCNGVIDRCGVCNGTDQCCLEYRGIPKERLDWILLKHTIEIAVQKLSAIDQLLDQTKQFVHSHNVRYRLNEFDPTGVVLPSQLPFLLSSQIFEVNKFCDNTGALNAVLDAFVNDLSSQIRDPSFPKVEFPHVTF